MSRSAGKGRWSKRRDEAVSRRSAAAVTIGASVGCGGGNEIFS